MKVVSVGKVPKNVSNSPLFTSNTVTNQPIVPPGLSSVYTSSQVNFPAGVRNRFHIHSADQLLIVTAGRGIVATETEQVEVTVGDVIFFPAGEKHWHGATKDSDFSHVYVTGAGSTTTQVEK